MNALDQLLQKTYHDSVNDDAAEPRGDSTADGQGQTSTESKRAAATCQASDMPEPTRHEADQTSEAFVGATFDGSEEWINGTLDTLSSVVGDGVLNLDVAAVRSDTLSDVSPVEAEQSTSQDASEEISSAESSEDVPAIDDAESDAPDATPFEAHWEVDQFCWPPVCLQLDKELEAELDEAVRRLQSSCQSGHHVVLVMSPERGVGRTTLTLSLARRAAKQGLNVAVLDLDHEHPRLTSQLGVSAEDGIESLCNEQQTAEGICIKALNDGVSFLPMVRPIDESPWTWPRFHDALRRVAQHHDLVLIDAAPGQVPSVADLSLNLAAVVLCHDCNDSSVTIQDFTAGLRASNIATVGVVDNFAA